MRKKETERLRAKSGVRNSLNDDSHHPAIWMKISFDIAPNVEIIRGKVHDNLRNSASALYKRLIASISFPKKFRYTIQNILIFQGPLLTL